MNNPLFRLTLLSISVSVVAYAGAQPFVLRRGIEFFYSDAGGDNSRLHTASVTSGNWTGQYDVIVKNVTENDIVLTAGYIHIGFAKSLGAGASANIIPGTDLVSLRYPSPNNQLISDNLNIVARAPWVRGDLPTNLMGGLTEVSGAPRPYGLHIPLTAPQGTSQTLSAGATMFLARIAFKDNGLFSAQGVHDLVLYDVPDRTGGGTNALLFQENGNTVAYHDGGDWFAHSRLTLVAPEPASTTAFALGAVVLLSRRTKRQ